jgi:hypothetical protein
MAAVGRGHLRDLTCINRALGVVAVGNEPKSSSSTAMLTMRTPRRVVNIPALPSLTFRISRPGYRPQWRCSLDGAGCEQVAGAFPRTTILASGHHSKCRLWLGGTRGARRSALLMELMGKVRIERIGW